MCTRSCRRAIWRNWRRCRKPIMRRKIALGRQKAVQDAWTEIGSSASAGRSTPLNPMSHNPDPRPCRQPVHKNKHSIAALMVDNSTLPSMRSFHFARTASMIPRDAGCLGIPTFSASANPWSVIVTDMNFGVARIPSRPSRRFLLQWKS
jgi:hypothetical protein